MTDVLVIVNKAIEVYKNTGIEQYPEARAIDYIENCIEPNSRKRQYAYNLFQFYLTEQEKA